MPTAGWGEGGGVGVDPDQPQATGFLHPPPPRRPPSGGAAAARPSPPLPRAPRHSPSSRTQLYRRQRYRPRRACAPDAVHSVAAVYGGAADPRAGRLAGGGRGAPPVGLWDSVAGSCRCPRAVDRSSARLARPGAPNPALLAGGVLANVTEARARTLETGGGHNANPPPPALEPSSCALRLPTAPRRRR